MKITPNLIKKNVQYQINCDSSKKRFLSLFLTLRSFSITFSICYWIHQKDSESSSFATAIEWVWRVFHKIFHHRTYSGPWNTQPLAFTVVFVLWDSAENSPCKINIFIKRYTVFVKSGDNMHDALLFTPLKKLSYILIQFISFWKEHQQFFYIYFDTSSINSPCFAPFALCLALYLQIRDKWTSNDSETNLTKEISNLPCNPLTFVGFFPALIIFHRIFWIFLQDKTRKISQWETVILISNRTFLWKIVGNVLERCTKFFATPNNLPILL